MCTMPMSSGPTWAVQSWATLTVEPGDRNHGSVGPSRHVHPVSVCDTGTTADHGTGGVELSSDSVLGLAGGHSGRRIERVGDEVRRPTGPHTRAVHALLEHLRGHGFSGAPSVLGVDEDGRERIEWIQGPVVHQDGLEPLSAQSLTEVGGLVREFHDLSDGFRASRDHAWSERAGDPDGPFEVLCHNDLATWNLISSDRGWVFIDWDLAAPGRRTWDLAWLVLSAVLADAEHHDWEFVHRRLLALLGGYGEPEALAEVLDVAESRAAREAFAINDRAAAGDEHFQHLQVTGHQEAWERATDHVARRRRDLRSSRT